MRIQKSNLMLDENYKNVLVKEYATNYPSLDKLCNPADIFTVMNDVFNLASQAEEYLYLICMTCSNRPICFFEVSHGTHNASLVGGREILIRALLCGATNMVIVHNHPSGNPTPSKADVQITSQVKAMADMVGIEFSDHIIIGKDGYYSFNAETSLLQKSGSIM